MFILNIPHAHMIATGLTDEDKEKGREKKPRGGCINKWK